MNKCRDCRFFESTEDECRRESPKVFIMTKSISSCMITSFEVTRFPETSPSSWCGQFESKDENGAYVK